MVLLGSPVILESFGESSVAFHLPSFGGFGYIIVVTKYSRRLPDRVIGNIIWVYSSDGNVCNGSLADLSPNLSLMSASERKADVSVPVFMDDLGAD